jgi:chemotaxis protein methyltransferase CheR
MSVARILSDPLYPDLKRDVLEHTGLAYYADKDEDFAARISRRFAVRGVRDCAAYRAALRDPVAGRPELDSLVGELTIGETYFFRQRAHFDLLRDGILPTLLGRNRSMRTLRIWSAGCATGAEPYSVALLLQLDLADKIEGWDISILGTDINVDFLARAREATFDDWAFRETPAAVKERCFRHEGKRWALRPEYRKYVSFRYHNLVSGAPVTAPGGRLFDVILCRNVIIYMAREKVRALAAQFYDSLAEGGVLLVGHAEPNAEIFQRFRPLVSGDAIAYRKVEEESPPAEPASESTVAPRPLWGGPPGGRPLGPPTPSSASADAEQVSISRQDAGPGEPARTSGSTPLNPAPDRPPGGVSVDAARALADRGEWREAAVLCRDVIDADALNAAAHFTLGLVLEHHGEAGQAERALRRAIYLDRRFALAHYHLGICLQTDAKAAQARKAFENALEILSASPDDEILEHGDGITVAELRDLTRMHLELLGER